MVAFLMLGIIPGTDIQIDFNTWLLSMGGICTLLTTFVIYRIHIIAKFRIALTIRRTNPTAILTARLA